MSKPKKPQNLNFDYKGRQLPLVELFEDCHAEQFADPGDILFTRTPVLFGEFNLFEDTSYAQQAEFSRKIAKYLTQYADWIETRKPSEDPNG